MKRSCCHHGNEKSEACGFILEHPQSAHVCSQGLLVPSDCAALFFQEWQLFRAIQRDVTPRYVGSTKNHTASICHILKTVNTSPSSSECPRRPLTTSGICMGSWLCTARHRSVFVHPTCLLLIVWCCSFHQVLLSVFWGDLCCFTAAVVQDYGRCFFVPAPPCEAIQLQSGTERNWSLSVNVATPTFPAQVQGDAEPCLGYLPPSLPSSLHRPSHSGYEDWNHPAGAEKLRKLWDKLVCLLPFLFFF